MSKFSIKTSIVNGIPFPSFVKQATYDTLVNLPLNPTDVFLVTHIKSGTTWLQQIATLLKRSGEKTSLDRESKHILETCPWIEVIGKEAAMVRVSVIFNCF